MGNELRACRSCAQLLPLDQFTRTQVRNRIRWMLDCKRCRTLSQRERYLPRRAIYERPMADRLLDREFDRWRVRDPDPAPLRWML